MFQIKPVKGGCPAAAQPWKHNETPIICRITHILEEGRLASGYALLPEVIARDVATSGRNE
jgi:hypothetical protein